MARVVVVDSGVLVAVLHERDAHHQWAQAHFRAVKPPFLTCEAVISESLFLLEGEPRAQEGLRGMLDRGVVKIDFSAETHLPDLLKLLRRYADIPMSFADACLVRMSERVTDTVTFTVDSDFKFYRRHGRQMMPVLAPW